MDGAPATSEADWAPRHGHRVGTCGTRGCGLVESDGARRDGRGWGDGVGCNGVLSLEVLGKGDFLGWGRGVAALHVPVVQSATTCQCCKSFW